MKYVFSLLQLWLILSATLINNIDCFFFCLWVKEQKYRQHHSAITSHTVVRGVTALVCVQPECSQNHSYLNLFRFIFWIQTDYQQKSGMSGCPTYNNNNNNNNNSISQNSNNSISQIIPFPPLDIRSRDFCQYRTDTDAEYQIGASLIFSTVFV